MTMIATTVELRPADGPRPTPVTFTEQGHGRPVLVLHGGAGPQSVTEFAALLAREAHVRVITPTHPGFAGAPRPEGLDSIADLATLYLALLDELNLVDVTVVGNSVGGWIAAEMATRESARIARVVLLDPVGIEVPGHPMADVFTMAVPEILRRSFADPAPFAVDPTTIPPEARRTAAANMAALAAYAASPSISPARLASTSSATAVIWGEQDEIADLEYGRSYAAAFPNARLQVLSGAGHLPQLEVPEQVLAIVGKFLAETAAWEHDFTVNTVVPPEAIWATLRNLYTGTKLSEQGDDIVLHGPFAAGTKLSVSPHGADFVVECEITELTDESYAYRSNFNGLYLTSRHTLTRLAAGGTRINHHSEIAGPRAEVVGPQIGARITADRAETMAELIDAAARSRGVASKV